MPALAAALRVALLGLWIPRGLLATQARLSRRFLSPGDQYLLSYDDFPDKFTGAGLQNRANIVQSTKTPIKNKKKPQPETLKIWPGKF
jgi:hypothetical protein